MPVTLLFGGLQMRRFLLTTAFIVGAGAVAVATPNYDGSVFWGDSTETDAQLAPVLDGWVLEMIDEAKREADELAATAREQGIPAGPMENGIEHRVMFESPEIVSVLREEWAYEGGANGSLWLMPVNWDARADQLIPIQSVLGDPAESQAAYDKVARLLEEATLAQVWNGNAQGWDGAIEAAVEPDPMYLSTFTFVPSTQPERIGGIAWHFEPYAVAPGAEGAVTVVIPQDELRDIVAPEWRGMLAGEPVEAVSARYVAPEDNRLQTVLARY